MAQELSSRKSELLQRRGIKLPPLITTFPDEMPKQLVSRYKSGLYGTHKHPLGGGSEISRWSSSSSSTSLEITVSNTGDDANGGGDFDEAINNISVDHSDEPKSDFVFHETAEQRLERWRKFYSERPLDWYFDKDDYEEYLDDVLFERLYKEVQYTVFETGPSKYRGQEHVRFFWEDVRKQLRDEESPVLEWPPTQERKHWTEETIEKQDDSRTDSKALPPRPKPPTEKGTADGKDPDLLELREFLMEKPRQKLEQ
jgi:hypothetical protein